MMSKPATLTKEELSTKIRDLLGGIDVDFTPMKKEDLIKLYEELSRLLRPFSDMSLREILDEALGEKSERFAPHLRARIRSKIKEIMEKREEAKKA